MEKRPSVFAGMKLSESAPEPPPPLDQRLFAPSKAPATKPSTPTEAREPKPTPTPAAAPAAPLPPVFDITELPYRKDTFLFTDDEWEAFDELKLPLRRQLDVKVTKNDLARCAVAYLVADYRRHGVNSPVIGPLKKRNGR